MHSIGALAAGSPAKARPVRRADPVRTADLIKVVCFITREILVRWKVIGNINKGHIFQLIRDGFSGAYFYKSLRESPVVEVQGTKKHLPGEGRRVSRGCMPRNALQKV